jgi:hypothetical protein
VATLKNTTINDTGFLTLPSGTTAQRPASPAAGMVRYNTTNNAMEYYNGTTWVSDFTLDGSSAARAAPSATYIKSVTGTTTNGLYWINLPTVGATQLYCDMNTDGGGWIHCGTFVDANQPRGEAYTTATQSGGDHPWAAPLMPAQDTGLWQNTTLLGSQSFTANYKNNGWVYFNWTQMLMKDSGDTLRNLFYTQTISSTTMSSFWTARQWMAAGSDSSSAAYSAGRVYGLSITNFGVVDPVLNSGNKSIILFKFGEADGVQDGNKDRTMIAAANYNQADPVDCPTGLGCFTYHDSSQGGPVQRWRTMMPQSNYPFNQDEPTNTNGGNTTYSYTMWVR